MGSIFISVVLHSMQLRIVDIEANRWTGGNYMPRFILKEERMSG